MPPYHRARKQKIFIFVGRDGPSSQQAMRESGENNSRLAVPATRRHSRSENSGNKEKGTTDARPRTWDLLLHRQAL